MSEKSPEFVADGVLSADGATVFVSREDGDECWTVRIGIGEDDDLGRLYEYPTITLYDRETLLEAWFDAYDALRTQALKLNNLATWIFNHLDDLSKEAGNGRA